MAQLLRREFESSQDKQQSQQQPQVSPAEEFSSYRVARPPRLIYSTPGSRGPPRLVGVPNPTFPSTFICTPTASSRFASLLGIDSSNSLITHPSSAMSSTYPTIRVKGKRLEKDAGTMDERGVVLNKFDSDSEPLKEEKVGPTSVPMERERQGLSASDSGYGSWSKTPVSIHHQATPSSSTFYSTFSSPASPTPTPSLLPVTPPRQTRPLQQKVTDHDPFLSNSFLSPTSTEGTIPTLKRSNSLFDTSRSRYRASNDPVLSANNRTPRKSTQQQTNDVIPSSSAFDKSQSSLKDPAVVENWKPRGVGTSMFAFPDRDAATIACLKRERTYAREGPGMSFVANVASAPLVDSNGRYVPLSASMPSYRSINGSSKEPPPKPANYIASIPSKYTTGFYPVTQAVCPPKFDVEQMTNRRSDADFGAVRRRSSISKLIRSNSRRKEAPFELPVESNHRKSYSTSHLPLPPTSNPKLLPYRRRPSFSSRENQAPRVPPKASDHHRATSDLLRIYHQPSYHGGSPSRSKAVVVPLRKSTSTGSILNSRDLDTTRMTPISLCEAYTFPKPILRAAVEVNSSSNHTTSSEESNRVGFVDEEERSVKFIQKEIALRDLEREEWDIRREGGKRGSKKNLSDLAVQWDELESTKKSSSEAERARNSSSSVSRRSSRLVRKNSNSTKPSTPTTPTTTPLHGFLPDSPPISHSFEPISTFMHKLASSISIPSRSPSPEKVARTSSGKTISQPIPPGAYREGLARRRTQSDAPHLMFLRGQTEGRERGRKGHTKGALSYDAVLQVKRSREAPTPAPPSRVSHHHTDSGILIIKKLPDQPSSTISNLARAQQESGDTKFFPSRDPPPRPISKTPYSISSHLEKNERPVWIREPTCGGGINSLPFGRDFENVMRKSERRVAIQREQHSDSLQQTPVEPIIASSKSIFHQPQPSTPNLSRASRLVYTPSIPPPTQPKSPERYLKSSPIKAKSSTLSAPSDPSSRPQTLSIRPGINEIIPRAGSSKDGGAGIRDRSYDDVSEDDQYLTVKKKGGRLAGETGALRTDGSWESGLDLDARGSCFDNLFVRPPPNRDMLRNLQTPDRSSLLPLTTSPCDISFPKNSLEQTIRVEQNATIHSHRGEINSETNSFDESPATPTPLIGSYGTVSQSEETHRNCSADRSEKLPQLQGLGSLGFRLSRDDDADSLVKEIEVVSRNRKWSSGSYFDEELHNQNPLFQSFSSASPKGENLPSNSSTSQTNLKVQQETSLKSFPRSVASDEGHTSRSGSFIDFGDDEDEHCRRDSRGTKISTQDSFLEWSPPTSPFPSNKSRSPPLSSRTINLPSTSSRVQSSQSPATFEYTVSPSSLPPSPQKPPHFQARSPLIRPNESNSSPYLSVTRTCLFPASSQSRNTSGASTQSQDSRSNYSTSDAGRSVSGDSNGFLGSTLDLGKWPIPPFESDSNGTCQN